MNFIDEYSDTKFFFFKYLALIIIDIVNSSYGLTHNEKEYLL